MTDPLDNFGAMKDGFERLWTPHRLVYLQDLQQPADEDCMLLEPGSKLILIGRPDQIENLKHHYRV